VGTINGVKNQKNGKEKKRTKRRQKIRERKGKEYLYE
jgi:hypothetical protein